MKWSFRRKLMTAFLCFGLVPTLIMTLVTTRATSQLTESSARLVYRAAHFASQILIRSPLDQARDPTDAVLDRARLGPVELTFDDFLEE